MRRAGVSRASRVVVYDDAGGSVAARLWWLLRAYGHDDVRVLDGGYAAWRAAGGAVEAEAVEVAEGDFAAGPGALAAVDRHAVGAAQANAAVVVLDARAGERFRGEVEPVDARPGHIPGAVSAPWSDNLVDGRFAAPAVLRARYEALGVRDGGRVICYCGSGVTACHDVLALERAGFEGLDVRLYEGSWSDWARDPDRPAALGG
jgi:thiosulfate/3-mercaptopyruvate sulfurtransferase